MSDMQEILANLIVALNEGQINAEVIEGAMKVLSAVPEIYHVDAVKALLSTPSALEEQPEDYLSVKTFTSNEFHIGDEVAYGKDRYVIYYFDEDTALVFGDGPVSRICREGSAFERTGRNFPAIAAIMEELKKA